MHITEIKKLPIEKRMLLMEQIWDTLCHEDEEIKSPSWHEDIINERMQLLNQGRLNLYLFKS